MDARPPTWTVVSIAMILALLLTAVMPGLPVGGARAAAQDAGESPVTPAAPAPVAVGPAAPESEITLNPVADATISVVSPDVNFGGDALLGTAMGYQTMSQPSGQRRCRRALAGAGEPGLGAGAARFAAVRPWAAGRRRDRCGAAQPEAQRVGGCGFRSAPRLPGHLGLVGGARHLE